MKQPNINITISKFQDDFFIKLYSMSGVITVAYGKSHASACKVAARKLRKLANEVERSTRQP